MLKPHDVAKYHHIDRPIFKHTLCDYVSNDNEILKKYNDKIVYVLMVFKPYIDTWCINCGAVYEIDNKFQEYNTLAKMMKLYIW